MIQAISFGEEVLRIGIGNALARIACTEAPPDIVAEVNITGLSPASTVILNINGLELEARKNLEIISDNLSDFTVGGNFTYVVSEVNVTPFEYEFGRNETRQLAGQSPYIMNFDISYNNDRTGTIVSLFYNIFGPRLAVVGSSSPARPNAFEQPVGSLDLTISQSLSDHWKLKFSAKNLLDPTVDVTQEFGGQEYIYSSYKRGRSFGMSLSYDF